jgi:hypothetical protein
MLFGLFRFNKKPVIEDVDVKVIAPLPEVAAEVPSASAAPEAPEAPYADPFAALATLAVPQAEPQFEAVEINLSAPVASSVADVAVESAPAPAAPADPFADAFADSLAEIAALTVPKAEPESHDVVIKVSAPVAEVAAAAPAPAAPEVLFADPLADLAALDAPEAKQEIEAVELQVFTPAAEVPAEAEVAAEAAAEAEVAPPAIASSTPPLAQAVAEPVAQAFAEPVLVAAPAAKPEMLSQMGTMKATREDVIAAYKIFLGRLPESMEVVDPRVGVSPMALLVDFLASKEFLDQAPKSQLVLAVAKKIIDARKLTAHEEANRASPDQGADQNLSIN